MLKLLEEFAEIPDKVKLLQLSNLMQSSYDNLEKSKEEFQSILRSLPADMVRIIELLCQQADPTYDVQVSTTRANDWTLMLEATTRGQKLNFLRILLENGSYCFS